MMMVNDHINNMGMGMGMGGDMGIDVGNTERVDPSTVSVDEVGINNEYSNGVYYDTHGVNDDVGQDNGYGYGVDNDNDNDDEDEEEGNDNDVLDPYGYTHQRHQPLHQWQPLQYVDQNNLYEYGNNQDININNKVNDTDEEVVIRQEYQQIYEEISSSPSKPIIDDTSLPLQMQPEEVMSLEEEEQQQQQPLLPRMYRNPHPHHHPQHQHRHHPYAQPIQRDQPSNFAQSRKEDQQQQQQQQQQQLSSPPSSPTKPVDYSHNEYSNSTTPNTNEFEYYLNRLLKYENMNNNEEDDINNESIGGLVTSQQEELGETDQQKQDLPEEEDEETTTIHHLYSQLSSQRHCINNLRSELHRLESHLTILQTQLEEYQVSKQLIEQTHEQELRTRDLELLKLRNENAGLKNEVKRMNNTYKQYTAMQMEKMMGVVMHGKRGFMEMARDLLGLEGAVRDVLEEMSVMDFTQGNASSTTKIEDAKDNEDGGSK